MSMETESIYEQPLSDELMRLSRQVEDAYRKCHVYETALEACGVCDEDRVLLEANKYYWATIQKIEFEEKALLTATLHNIIMKGKPTEQLTAIKMLGEIIYPEKFGKMEKNNDSNVQVQIYIPDNGRQNTEKRKG